MEMDPFQICLDPFPDPLERLRARHLKYSTTGSDWWHRPDLHLPPSKKFRFRFGMPATG
jgi:hypothetical protein